MFINGATMYEFQFWRLCIYITKKEFRVKNNKPYFKIEWSTE